MSAEPFTTEHLLDHLTQEAEWVVERGITRGQRIIIRELLLQASREIDRLRAAAAIPAQPEPPAWIDVVRKVAVDLYAAEVHRQSCGWDDYCISLVVRSQHALAALLNAGLAPVAQPATEEQP
jgi:hypothetical protein